MPRRSEYHRNARPLIPTDSDARYDRRFLDRRHLSLDEAAIYCCFDRNALKSILHARRIRHADITPRLLDDILALPCFKQHRLINGIGRPPEQGFLQ